MDHKYHITGKQRIGNHQQEYKECWTLALSDMHGRVIYHENHLAKLCTLLSEYIMKNAAVRDKNDEIAKCIAKFASEENYNTMSKLALTMVGELMAKIGDHRNAEVQRLEANVLPTLTSYGNICKYLKADIHNAISAQQRSISRQNEVDKLKEKLLMDPKGQTIVAETVSNLKKLMAKSSRLQHLAQCQMIKFEQKRIQDMKESLLGFFKIEIALHAKALEYYTEAYQHIDNIDEDCDMTALKKGMGIEEINNPMIRKSNNHKFQSKPSEGEVHMQDNWRNDFTRNYFEEIRNYRTSTPNTPNHQNRENLNNIVSASASAISNSESEVENTRTREEKDKKMKKMVSFEESDSSGRILDADSVLARFISDVNKKEKSVVMRKSVLTKKHS